MIGAIAGDIIGSLHEWAGTKRKDFPLWDARCRLTDDTVLTVAVAEHLLTGDDLVDLFHAYVRAYPRAGYGGRFVRWAEAGSREPYGSWGNGSAMRVSPVGFAAASLEDALDRAAAGGRRGLRGPVRRRLTAGFTAGSRAPSSIP
jgi:ADP-ribosylglycohydrolase